MNQGPGEEERRRSGRKPGAEWHLQTSHNGAKNSVTAEGIFDELVVDHWLHVERLEERVWWMRVGDVRLAATVAVDGTITVDLERGFYGEERGVTRHHRPPGE